MSYALDSLVYSGIKNNLSGNDLTTVTSRITVPPNMSETEYLTKLLDKTTIKRACCINNGRSGVSGDNFIVPVRIPIPKDFDFSQVSEPRASLYRKFGYIDKSVYVPKALCNTLDGNYNYNTNQCQDFMYLYCENVKKMYRDEIAAIGGNYNDDEFYAYKPECACYNRQPSYIVGSGIPPSCYAPGCDPNNNNVFMDTNSRKGCNVTICQTNLDTSGLSAGGTVTINSKVSQQCGNQLQDTGAQTTTSPPEVTPPPPPPIIPQPITPPPPPEPITPPSDDIISDNDDSEIIGDETDNNEYPVSEDQEQEDKKQEDKKSENKKQEEDVEETIQEETSWWPWSKSKTDSDDSEGGMSGTTIAGIIIGSIILFIIIMLVLWFMLSGKKKQNK